MEGDLQASFNTLWGGFKGQYRILQGGEILSEHSPKGYDAFHARAIAADRNGVRWKVFVLGARFQNRIETVMYMSNVLSGGLAEVQDRVFNSFLSSLRFSNEAADEAAARAGEAERKKRLAQGRAGAGERKI